MKDCQKNKEEMDRSSNMKIIRCHLEPRSDLFSPFHVQGSPSIQKLCSERVTTGVFVDSGKSFEIVDTDFKRMHRGLRSSKERWTGQTEFRFKSD